MLCNGFALRNRFDGLPLHKICYYHSHDQAEVAIRDLSSELGAQSSSFSRASRGNIDCIGMTPLHILACSTKHHLDMYKMLISKYPGHLITEDVWGDIPLLYAIWGRAPQEVVTLLCTSIREYHEDYIIDWERMIETMCIGMAPLTSIDYLRAVNEKHFPDQSLQKLDWKNMVRLLCTKAKAPEEYVGLFISHYSSLLNELEQVPLQLAKEEKFGFKSWWLRIGISKRLSLLGKQNMPWQQELEALIVSCPIGGSLRTVKRRHELIVNILSKLALYETIAQMWVLELALWKYKLEESSTRGESQRKNYRYLSGAELIIPNVMEFLIDMQRG